MSLSWLPDKIADILQLTLSLLQTRPVTVHQVMSFLEKANFCANGHSQLWRLCHVMESDMLTVYDFPYCHLPICVIRCFTLFLAISSTFEVVLDVLDTAGVVTVPDVLGTVCVVKEYQMC